MLNFGCMLVACLQELHLAVFFCFVYSLFVPFVRSREVLLGVSLWECTRSADFVYVLDFVVPQSSRVTRMHCLCGVLGIAALNCFILLAAVPQQSHQARVTCMPAVVECVTAVLISIFIYTCMLTFAVVLLVGFIRRRRSCVRRWSGRWRTRRPSTEWD